MPKEHRILTLQNASNAANLKLWLEKVNKLINDDWVIITSHGDKNFIRLILERERRPLDTESDSTSIES